MCGRLQQVQAWAFRKREKAAVAVSAGLRKRLNDARTDPDAFWLPPNLVSSHTSCTTLSDSGLDG